MSTSKSIQISECYGDIDRCDTIPKEKNVYLNHLHIPGQTLCIYIPKLKLTQLNSTGLLAESLGCL